MAPGEETTGRESGFVIDGKQYEVPALDSLNMGERRVMYELAGLVQEDFVRTEGEADDDYDERVEKLVRHPGFMETLMHVAYARGNPGMKREKVAAVIESTNYLDAVASLLEDEPEDDARPPDPSAKTSEPAASSRSGSEDSESSTKPSSATGGDDSKNGSEEPGSVRPSTGTGRSATSSPASGRVESRT